MKIWFTSKLVMAGMDLPKKEGDEIATLQGNEFYQNGSGDFHKYWEWRPVGMSRNGKYVLHCLGVRDEKFNFYFMLLDKENAAAALLQSQEKHHCEKIDAEVQFIDGKS